MRIQRTGLLGWAWWLRSGFGHSHLERSRLFLRARSHNPTTRKSNMSHTYSNGEQRIAANMELKGKKLMKKKD